MSDGNRPLFHFAPEHGWINDPNGLVRLGDEWHLAAFILPEVGCGRARLSVSGGACRVARLELRVPADLA